MTQEQICCLSSVLNASELSELSVFLEKLFTVYSPGFFFFFFGVKGGFWRTTFITVEDCWLFCYIGLIFFPGNVNMERRVHNRYSPPNHFQFNCAMITFLVTLLTI